MLIITLLSFVSLAHCLSSTLTQDANAFYVKDNATGVVCLVIRMNATFHIAYNTTNNATNTVQVPLVNRTSTNVTGSCSQGWKSQAGESIKFTWMPSNSTSAWNFTLYLGRTSKDVFFVSQMQLQYNRTHPLFVNATNNGTVHTIYALPNYNASVQYFDTNLGQYYECIAKQTVDLQEQSRVVLDNVMIEAFRKNSTIDFLGKRNRCSSDNVIQNLVPIIVGVTLALLIVIILIAYIVGRRHSHHGYQSI